MDIILDKLVVSTFLFQCLLAFPLDSVSVTKNCTIRPSGLVIPCTQYTFEGRTHCSERSLKDRFPNLYTTTTHHLAGWPGPPTNVQPDRRNVAWRPPLDDTSHSLRGFQVMSEGNSVESFGKLLCTIIYLTNSTDTRISLLRNVTFEVSINTPGDYSFQITSLPRRGTEHQQKPTKDISADISGKAQTTVTSQMTGDGYTRNCTIHPTTSLIPCILYMFKGPGLCSERSLQNRLPAAYSLEKKNLVSWPSSPTKIHVDDRGTRNLTWKAPIDGSIRYLEGFQITLEGTSYESFGKILCAVLYLVNNTEDRISSIMNATFEVQFDSPGDYHLEIKSLPLPNKAFDIGTMNPPITFPDTHDYHPNISVDLWSEQLNASAINVTIDVSPDLENITSYFLEAYYHSYDLREVPELIKDTVPSEKKYAVLGNLRVGNYTLKFRPKDEFPDDRSKCICYIGLPTSRSCTPCRSYVKTIRIDPVTANTNKKNEIGFLEIGLPITVTLLFVLLTLVVCLFSKRARTLICCKTEDVADKRSLYVLHAWDNENHDAVVKLFIKYLRDRFDCAIISQSELIKETSETKKLLEHLTSADLVIIIHSEAAFRLFNVFKTECLCNFSHTFGSINDSFVMAISKLVFEQCSRIMENTISIHFDCTPEEFVINEFQLNRFKLTDDFIRLDKFLQRKLHQTKLKILDGSICKELTKQSEGCKVFQLSNPYWFSELYRRITKSSFSSDDSGVDVQRELINNFSSPIDHCSMHKNLKDKYRRRSVSLETLSGQFCRSASMQRDNSFSLSEVEKRFISPEYGDEKEDTPTVILAEQMRAINDRYDYIVNQDLKLSNGSFEKLGTSV